MEEHLKRLERDSRRDPSILDREEILGLLEEPNWVIRMLLCRLISRVQWDESEMSQVQEFVLLQSSDSNKFVQAWSLDALSALALQFPNLRPEATRRVRLALGSGPSSVRVRARKAVELLDPYEFTGG